jgi:hypothetical protein
MPKTPTDYGKTIIYKIVCNDLNVKECYVGHTINMTKRKWAHKSICHNENNKRHNLKIYKIIRENGGWDNWTMLLVEKFPCKDKHEACKREREVYEELDAKMNTFRPYRTQEDIKEKKKQYNEEHKAELKQYIKQYNQEHKAERNQYSKQYNQEHKAEINEKNKQYYQERKAEISEKRKEKIECEYCYKRLSKGNMSPHLKICKSK